MANTQIQSDIRSEGAIFARLWDTKKQRLTPPFARYVLKLEFSDEDKARMHELALKNRESILSADESDELDNFVRVGDLLAILQSKARKLLKRKPQTQNHG